MQSNPQLQSIELKAKHNGYMEMEKLLQMIKNNAAITELTLDWAVSCVNKFDVQQLANEHPMLIKVNLWWFGFSVDKLSLF